MPSKHKQTHSLSIIIPAFNAAQWLQPTIEKIDAAVKKAPSFQAEVIIVNDGSSDDTSSVAHALTFPNLKLRVIDQSNKGRFLARKTGLDQAKGDWIFYIDTRVFLDSDAFVFLAKQLAKHPERKVWNGHVHVSKKGNVIARFGDAITFIGWRRYFHHPKLTSYGLEEFDFYPKGTGCFFVPCTLLQVATKEFLKTSHDLQYSSDDTLLIRLIAAKEKIHISPEFACTYFARTRLSQFIKHSYNRGKFFVDGFLRKGTRFYYPLLVFLALSILLPIFLIVFPQFLLYFVIGFALIWIVELLAALVLGTPPADALSLFTLTPLFTVAYGAGIWRAFIRKLLT